MLPNGSYVTDVVAIGDRVVAVGNLERGLAAAFWTIGALPDTAAP